MMLRFGFCSLLVGLSLALTGLASPAEGRLEGALSNGNPWEICARATRQTEQREGLPQHLLSAISLAESGRWSSEKSASLAWPWTVTSGGPGKFFPDMTSAIKHVEKLQKQGITNIDVGCMQINLHFHGHAFPSLEHAFWPEENTAYAADFLKRLFETRKSWMAAAGSYHSNTPHRHKYYSGKVARFWAKLREENPDFGMGADTSPLDNEIAQAAEGSKDQAPPQSENPEEESSEADWAPVARFVDQNRTRDLNDALRKRKAEQRLAAFTRGSEQLRQAGIRLEQIRAYRDRRQVLQAQEVERVMNKARRELREEQSRLVAEQRDREERFEKKRRAQLERWRTTGQLNSSTN